MHNLPSKSLKAISWNGISITVPANWEVKATGNSQLNFEHNFQAILEMRWQKITSKDHKAFIARSIKQIEKHTTKKLKKIRLKKRHTKLLSPFSIESYTSLEDDCPQYLFLFDKNCSMFIMLQFLKAPGNLHPLESIDNLHCIPLQESISWSIQDFSFTIPSSFSLLNHTMDAGFTVLNFHYDKTRLHICRLAPARLRLQQSSLKEILFSLLGAEKEQFFDQISDTTIQYERSPSILRQILLRIQRKHPFQRAKIWHDTVNDRLLGVFMEAIHPIDDKIHSMICSSYEISPRK